MKHQTTHLKKLHSSYMRRKYRVNMTIKSHGYSHRLLVAKSNMHTYAQIIDSKGFVLCGMSDAAFTQAGKVIRAEELGKAIAAASLAKGVSNVVFDRNGYLYHGRVKALADGARQGGLVF